MMKACCLVYLICFTGVCLAQTKDTYYGIVLTKTESDDTGIDTTRLLYCRNIAGNQLSVYTVANGMVSEATAYQLTEAKKGLFLQIKPILPGQLMKDSLSIAFLDQANTVMINQRDQYQLFPTYYTWFKQQVKVKHAIMPLFNLLADGLGDYPIADALPLVNLRPALNQQIRQAIIVTQRSQADIKDTWTCTYSYNSHHQLTSTRAGSFEETRFTKKVRYSRFKVRSINTYLNIEDRQVTKRAYRYDRNCRNVMRWEEQVDELGKNRQTTSSITLILHDLGQLRKMEPSVGEVLKLFKPIKTQNYTKE